MDKISIIMPDNNIEEFEKGVPIVVLGANGAGKTRFSIKIEELNDPNYINNTKLKQSVHRLSAQKSLNIDKSLVIKGLESSERIAHLGNDAPGAYKQGYRFGNDPVVKILDDYNSVLSLLFAKNNRVLEEQHFDDVEKEKNNEVLQKRAITLIEKASAIWDEIMPNRKLDLSGNEVHIFRSIRYHGRDMSDGERVVLYMIAQILTVKNNSLIIIDEPELHIHKAILSKLWNMLEIERQDCVFMYITHDLDFAVTRNTDKALWIKNYDGLNNWDYEFVNINDFSNLPSTLLYELIGTQKRIIFVEGTKESLDYMLYHEIYGKKGFHVIPCGGCNQVIKYVKAKKAYDKFDSIIVIGIIDRDFRTEAEIQSLKNEGVYCLNVAEVENLFIVPEIIEYVGEYLGTEITKIEEAKKFIVDTYNEQVENQITKALHSELTYKLTGVIFKKSERTPQQISVSINSQISEEVIEKILMNIEKKYTTLTELKRILEVFNYKSLSVRIGNYLGLSDKEYPNQVIKLVKKNKDILKCFELYLPIFN